MALVTDEEHARGLAIGTRVAVEWPHGRENGMIMERMAALGTTFPYQLRYDNGHDVRCNNLREHVVWRLPEQEGRRAPTPEPRSRKRRRSERLSANMENGGEADRDGAQRAREAAALVARAPRVAKR